MRRKTDELTPTTRKSTEAGILVPDAQCKLQFFFKGGISEGLNRIECVHKFAFASRRAMAEIVGLTEAQLKGTSQGENFLSKASIETLGRHLGFDTTWSEWRSGRCAAFAMRYNKDNTYAARLFACIRAQPAVAPDPQLASLTLRSTKNSPMMPWPLSLDLTCDASPEQELTLWVRHGRIVFKIGKSGVTLPVEQRKRYPRDFLPENSRSSGVTIDPISGDQIAIWILSVKEGVLGSISLPDLIEVLNIEPDADTEVSLRVYVKDLGSNAGAAVVVDHAGEKSVRKGETQSVGWQGLGGARAIVSAAKAKIAQRLAVLEIQERTIDLSANIKTSPSEQNSLDRLYDGWIILARDQLRFVTVSETGTSRE